MLSGPLEFSDHAKRRMQQRNISEDQVHYALKYRDNVYKHGKCETHVAGLPPHGNPIIKVKVRIPYSNPLFIVDVFLTEVR